ncbi:hypothetical protein L1987_16549 [Smallanthus sonchifolius]|uniref:Uncharacterized protein n=1 Tax=Smallanthus sonchifolius TaxID=185202 RepID=A0ACB9J9H8_9ASTR|nr:hypothetical protein L1987_16549 [Smallanthus sonchifolius]
MSFSALLAFVIVIPSVLAGTMRQSTVNAHSDRFIEERAHNATKAAMSAYNPHPELAILDFNKEVQDSLVDTNNSTRRKLKGRGGCMATNPIDRCWRCNKNWAQNRQALGECARGFGERTTGGMDGEIYVVTDDSDDDMLNPKKGTLRWGVIQEKPLWIIFERSMIITLQQELIMSSDKTIDGGSMNPTIISQGNRFRAPDNVHAKEVTHRDHFGHKVWKHWRWRTVNDLFLNGAFFVASGDHSDIGHELKRHMVQAKDGSAVGLLTRYAGVLQCWPHRPC